MKEKKISSRTPSESKEALVSALCDRPIDTLLDTGWSLASIVEKLCEATDVLLHQYDYDGDGYESLGIALQLGKAWLQYQENPTSTNREALQNYMSRQTNSCAEKFELPDKMTVPPPPPPPPGPPPMRAVYEGFFESYPICSNCHA